MGIYELSRKADDDLAALYLYGLTTFGLKQADSYFDSLCSRLQDIADDPLRFPKSSYLDLYRYSVHAPHTVYYEVVGAGIIRVIRILRSQDPRSSLVSDLDPT
ncbi:MAG: type II toxin-antitoxin system RelE/ParE family toxin [Epibacterium sp.]|nr:type II toxin-antitoxin system RelE/ParE family toxin [Epibacterium sp.]